MLSSPSNSSRIISTRSSTVNKDFFFGLRRTATQRRSKHTRPLRRMDRCPLVMGSKLPG